MTGAVCPVGGVVAGVRCVLVLGVLRVLESSCVIKYQYCLTHPHTRESYASDSAGSNDKALWFVNREFMKWVVTHTLYRVVYARVYYGMVL